MRHVQTVANADDAESINRSHKVITRSRQTHRSYWADRSGWTRRLGMGALAFFFVKGLVWLALAALAGWGILQ